MNFIRVRLTPDVRIDRIQRFMNFFHLLGDSPAKLLLELNNIDDADKSIKQKFKLFEGLRVYSLGLHRCNLQERDTHDFLFIGAHRLLIKDSFISCKGLIPSTFTF